MRAPPCTSAAAEGESGVPLRALLLSPRERAAVGVAGDATPPSGALEGVGGGGGEGAWSVERPSRVGWQGWDAGWGTRTRRVDARTLGDAGQARAECARHGTHLPGRGKAGERQKPCGSHFRACGGRSSPSSLSSSRRGGCGVDAVSANVASRFPCSDERDASDDDDDDDTA